MKKRLLIASHGLELGGAESSLIGYLHELSQRKDVETDLFLYAHKGELMKYIPESINLLPQKKAYACLATPIAKVLKKGCFRVAAGRWWGKRKAKAFHKKTGLSGNKSAVGIEYSHKYTRRFMPKISDVEYDLAVSFLTPHYFVAEKVKAAKKVAYIHTDYSYITVDRESEKKMWDTYDLIAAVSETVKNGFVTLFPELDSKVTVIENVNPVTLIKARADEIDVKAEMPDDGSVKLLSVGRFCDAKNFESIPKKIRLLTNKGVNAKWYIIGFGNDSLIRSAMKDTGTEDKVIILGKKNNPYPYIKECDIYAQPSRYEGKAVTVLEAQILEKPVIISKYATSAAQLKDGFDGVIAPMDDESFAEVLSKLIKNKEERYRLSENCKRGDYSNKSAVDELLETIND